MTVGMTAMQILGRPMRAIARAEATACAELADELTTAIDDDLAKTFPPAHLIERDRAEAVLRLERAAGECERLETALVDLDTCYERRRAGLVAELTEARQAAAAAGIWADALHPGVVIPEEEADG